MAKTSPYATKIYDLSKSGTEFKLMKPNIDKAHAAFETYFGKHDLKPIAKKDREKKFNELAAVYLGGAWGIGYDDPTIAGGQIKTYLSRLQNGSEILQSIYTAIERADRTDLEGGLKRALESLGGNKLESTIQEVRDRPHDEKPGIYGEIGDFAVGDPRYKGDPIAVGENLPGAISAIRQNRANAEAFGKSKSNPGSLEERLAA